MQLRRRPGLGYWVLEETLLPSVLPSFTRKVNSFPSNSCPSCLLDSKVCTLLTMPSTRCRVLAGKRTSLPSTLSSVCRNSFPSNSCPSCLIDSHVRIRLDLSSTRCWVLEETSLPSALSLGCSPRYKFHSSSFM